MILAAFIISGVASWFHPEDFTPTIVTSSPWVCAMNAVKPGTEVQVENVANGRLSKCLVTGSGPCCGRVLDASPKVANQLGFTGLTNVRVYRVVKEFITLKVDF